MFIYIMYFDIHSPLQFPFWPLLVCKVTSVEIQTAVTWITQNFKRGRESNRSMSWQDSWTFSNRIEAFNDILTGLSEAFDQFCHLVYNRMHVQLFLPQHYSSTDAKAQVLSRCYPLLSHGIWSSHAGTTDLQGTPGQFQDAIQAQRSWPGTANAP